MLLKRLYINEYKIFKDFTYEFPHDFKRYINVLIGVNGSGKSTILEAIAEIFSCVILNKESKFGFKLEYILKHEEVLNSASSWEGDDLDSPYFEVIISVPDKGVKPDVSVTLPDKKILNSISEINVNKNLKSIKPNLPSNLYKVLPENIVIYYSGLSEIMKTICEPHNKKLSENYRKGITDIPQLFFYYEPPLFNLILISLLSFEYGDIPGFLKEKANITGFENIKIYLKKPYWARANDTIKNFWGAKGEVKIFLEYLNSIKGKLFISNPIDGKKGNLLIEEIGSSLTEEKLLITIIGKEKLFQIREHFVEERSLFNLLKALYIDDLLKDVEFSFYKESDSRSETFGILSEGEQQAITIKGLSELLGEENTLFLFDEPDTYLHPLWQRKFISEIEESIEQNNWNEISYIIATHSPQILSNAKPEKSFVKIIENGQLVENTPKYYGREISSILYNLMGVEERNETIKKDLSNLFKLIEEEEIEEATQELERLKEILGETDSDIQMAIIQLSYLEEE